MKKPDWLALLRIGFIFTAITIPAFAQTAPSAPTAASPYTLSVFATAPSGLSAPDSVAVLDDYVFVGYGDNHDPGGADGLSSQVVEYRMDGSIVHIYTVVGHNDGVKIDPVTHLVWALQNEDGNSNLVIIDPETQSRKTFQVGTGPHGGGYDDITFRGCQAYFSASNPTINPNTAPAIVSVHFEGSQVQLAGVLQGDANAIDVPTGSTIQLNLQDPDSMTLDPFGNLVLDSQGDQEIIIVSDPGSHNQRVLHVPLTYQASPGMVASVETDDTNYATSSQGFVLFADKGLNAVYKLTTNAFAPGTAYTAADGGPFVGTLNFSTGLITPIVTGLSGPGGLVFVDTSKQGRDWDNGHDLDACRQGEDRHF